MADSIWRRLPPNTSISQVESKPTSYRSRFAPGSPPEPNGLAGPPALGVETGWATSAGVRAADLPPLPLLPLEPSASRRVTFLLPRDRW